jgi:hypothetical protein
MPAFYPALHLYPGGWLVRALEVDRQLRKAAEGRRDVMQRSTLAYRAHSTGNASSDDGASATSCYINPLRP